MSINEHKFCCNCSASGPVIISSITDGCIQQGQNVRLTCEVTYSGTNLMPLKMDWYWSWSTNYRTNPSSWYDEYTTSNNTTNASSVHQSTWTFTAREQTAGIYWCKVSFSSPTGLVLPGVYAQSLSSPQVYLWSSPFTPRTVASKIVVYV